ncbi:phosphate ABC transporter, periplasmic phosphate-binding protein [Methylocella silvestris BL2]|uniref:Phosphate-binding protein PstS n=1 Tax=Methylocella silvestris (strain DSM 15510 / CIP 108128 / LMG 27833 / NCIMB 13906 / BL2) TaxID=395965 RepID=B8EQ82_METSB|nr:phosphate ABC transporter substrate-binding protein PstS [Methylocella silvestris]ACK51572.1 phosphate ABC transporter, periplasmic phosphate-binding protein [Methylocella silvestris BL2]
MNIRVKTIALTAAGVFFAGALVANISAPAMAAAVDLHGAGSTFAAPLYEAWINSFVKSQPDVSLRYEAVGSGEGLARFIAGAVDFAGSDLPLPAAEAEKIKRGVIQLPSTAGMIVLAYNLPGLQGALKLPQDVYVDIFSGKITSWRDPRIAAANPGLNLPSADITVVGRQDSSGTTYAFTSHLAAVNKNWSPTGSGVGKIVSWPHGAMLARGNEGVASRIKISVGSIGYVEYGFAHRLGLPMASLQNKDGDFVTATAETGAAALASSAEVGIGALDKATTNPAGKEAYPIVTYSWLLLYRSYPGDEARILASFVGFGLDKGQGYAADLGYIALPRNVVELAKTAVSKLQ